ncbi:DUF3662 and FHA domain-containing protein [Corynebacterium heidelbergense]|uniref:DUF2662 domain-containing protein n=1 Tax=Corynebacterium heidelbergense TaxID=2055947 RepID=A0A364V6L4_9CORY|nr:DUF3662 and FHA domain-containing protein [Corynebacterium heidelbergense]RAV32287.1 DUF2662 domain-containing protein [Corynebacterium heidelbergense]
MDLFGKFRKLDSSLQRGLDNGFARVFGGEVVPAEIDDLLKQQAESSVMVNSDGEALAPSYYGVFISEHDHLSLMEKRPDLAEFLADKLTRFIRNQGWRTSGPIAIEIIAERSLHSGQLKSDCHFDRPQRPPQDPRSQPGAQPTPRSDAQNAQWGYPAENYPVNHNPGDTGASYAPSAQDFRHSPGGTQNPGAPNPYNWSANQHRPDGPEDNSDSSDPGQSVSSPSAAAVPASSQDANNPSLAALVNPGPQRDRHPGEDAYGSSAAPNLAERDPEPPNPEPPNPAGQDPAVPDSAPVDPPQPTVTLLLRDGSNRTYQLQRGSNLIGRGSGVDLRIPDTGVSRQHAEIQWDGYDAVLTDLQSTNGTTVNDMPIENWLLANGDVISLGHSEIEVQFL